MRLDWMSLPWIRMCDNLDIHVQDSQSLPSVWSKFMLWTDVVKILLLSYYLYFPLNHLLNTSENLNDHTGIVGANAGLLSGG